MALDMIPPEDAAVFLIDAGWRGAEIAPLAGDASFRRYFRVALGGRSAVLMDAPPPHEDPRPFVHIAQWLIESGFVAPGILHSDLDKGLLLITDLGGNRLREAVDVDPGSERGIYEGIVDLLAELHRQPPPLGLRTHGLDAWLDEVGLFPEWYGRATGLALDADSFRAAWRSVLAPIDALGQSVIELRDFHAENIMLIDGAEGLARFGLLDFQDALIGHPAYDLVSMLEDARRDVPPLLERDMLDRYMRATGAGPEFEAAYWVLGAQRNTRILGVFCRLWLRDHKPHYTRFQPRMWGLLERDLAHPALAPIKAWFDAHVREQQRADIWDTLGV